jgi:ABC-type uncharacterized transport system permease subunit
MPSSEHRYSPEHNVNIALALIVFALYAGAGYGLLRMLLQGPESFPGRGRSLALGGAGALLHLGLLSYSALMVHGINLGFFGAASLFAWVMSALLLVTALRRPVENVGIIVLPLAGLVVLLNGLLGRPEAAAQPLPAGLTSHVGSSVLAYSVLAVAAGQALLLALQEYRLHHKHPGGFVRLLPPMQTMEHLLFQMLGLGFVLLTISLVTGFLFLDDMFAQHLVHKTLLSLAAWGVFATLLIGRWRFGWRGQTAIRWTLGGFIVLMLAYFGSKFVLELILHRR